MSGKLLADSLTETEPRPTLTDLELSNVPEIPPRQINAQAARSGWL